MMASWVLLAVFALPLDEQFHVDNGAPLAALLAALAAAWLALAVTAAVLAVRHAKATQGLPAFAWSAVPALLALALPAVVSLVVPYGYTEDEGAVCSPGLIQAAVPDALFGWIPWPAYVAVPLLAVLAGLGFLAKPSTRRPGAWLIASALMAVSLWMVATVLITNHCD